MKPQLILSGCLLLLSLTPSSIVAQTLPQPIFKNGEAQIVPEFSDEKKWIEEELWVETTFDSDNDGRMDRMHVWVTRPAQTKSGQLKLPIVFMPSPYYGIRIWSFLFPAKNTNWNVQHEIGATPSPHEQPKLGTRKKRPLGYQSSDKMWVPRGYITVYSSSPGTGLSDGVPTIGGENEALAPKAVIDWLCGRAKGYKSRRGKKEVVANWCSGKIGMKGASYDGTLCIAAATTGVEGLEAIIPVAPVTSWYHYYRSNGLVRSPGGYLGEDMDVMYDAINTGKKSRRKKNNKAIREQVLLANMDRITGDYNDFWASRDYLRKLDTMHAAMIMAHGFNDWNVMTEQSYRFYKAAKDKGLPVQFYCHQDSHGGDPPFTMMNRWFTRYLHGVENGVEQDPPVQLVREHARTPTAYDSYPDATASDVTLFPKTGGSNTGTLGTEKVANQPVDTLSDNVQFNGEELIDPQNAAHRLLYVTPTLDKDLRISGTAQVTIRLASDKPAANLSVWLVSLPLEEGPGTKIYDDIITRGWADPQNYKSLTRGEALKPGEFHDVSFDLMPDDQVIQKGQQIGLLIFSSDKEFTLWPAPGTELMVDLNATSITLPVVGGAGAFDQAIVK